MQAFLRYCAMLLMVSGGAAGQLIHVQSWSTWEQDWTLTSSELEADDVCSNALFASMDPETSYWTYLDECTYYDFLGDVVSEMWTMLPDGKVRLAFFDDASCTIASTNWTYNSTCLVDIYSATTVYITKVEVVQGLEVGRLELFSDSNCTQEVTSDGAGEPFPTDTCIHYGTDMLQFSCSTDGVSTIDWWNRTNWQDQTCATPTSTINCRPMGDGLYEKFKCPDVTTTSKAHETWTSSLAWVLALSAWVFLV
mmetsp:Transcript_15588/g.28324  ORF Transcript_15588/g.28324 Transcript_15588/m.28324 type:complete len:252 (-) Transcript_15588:103-858(-)